MCLEKCISREKFNENASNAPNITGITPTKVEDDLWCSIMSGGYDRGMVFVIECSGTKVNQSDFSIEQYSPLRSSPSDSLRGRWDLTIVGEGLILG